MGGTAVRVLAVADTDSYLKWSVATLAGLPGGWSRQQVVLRNAVMPSAGQIAAAGAGEASVVSLPRLLRLLARERPDVLLLACTGPVVTTLAALPPLRGPDRPVLLTGLPGISYPASARALALRRSCDLFLLHSHRERAGFARLAAAQGQAPAFGLARLPFLVAADASEVGAPAGGPLVFAAQAQVPVTREDRERVLRSLAAASPAVVKLRAGAGEQQTHRERHPYDVLWAGLVARGEVAAGAVRFSTGAMSEALAAARGLVTVSSTAALEAVARGLPVLVLDDFGISAELVNLVFAGSGCTGSMAALAADDLRHPSADWRADNYFHPEEDCDWLARLTGLVGLRDQGRLLSPPAPLRRRPAGVLRQYLRLSVSAAQRRRLAGAAALPRALGRRARARLRGRRAAAAPAEPPP